MCKFSYHRLWFSQYGLWISQSTWHDNTFFLNHRWFHFPQSTTSKTMSFSFFIFFFAGEPHFCKWWLGKFMVWDSFKLHALAIFQIVKYVFSVVLPRLVPHMHLRYHFSSLLSLLYYVGMYLHLECIRPGSIFFPSPLPILFENSLRDVVLSSVLSCVTKAFLSNFMFIYSVGL